MGEKSDWKCRKKGSRRKGGEEERERKGQLPAFTALVLILCHID